MGAKAAITPTKMLAGPGSTATYIAMRHIYCNSLEELERHLGQMQKIIKGDTTNFTNSHPIIQVSEVMIKIQKNRNMNTAIWIIQGLLAAFFAMPDFTKLTSSQGNLIEKKMLKPNASNLPVRGIGMLELLGVFSIYTPAYGYHACSNANGSSWFCFDHVCRLYDLS